MQETQETQVHSLVGKIPWRRKWQPTAVVLPGESHGPGSLVDYSPAVHGVARSRTRLKQLSTAQYVYTRICTHMYLHRLMDLVCNSISATIGPPENIRVTPKEGSLIIRLSAPFDVPASEASFVYHVYYWEEAGGKQARACPSLFLMFFSLEFLSSKRKAKEGISLAVQCLRL